MDERDGSHRAIDSRSRFNSSADERFGFYPSLFKPLKLLILKWLGVCEPGESWCLLPRLSFGFVSPDMSFPRAMMAFPARSHFVNMYTKALIPFVFLSSMIALWANDFLLTFGELADAQTFGSTAIPKAHGMALNTFLPSESMRLPSSSRRFSPARRASTLAR